jgi:glycosyltransferase involved in cell wall biosynthesis
LPPMLSGIADYSFELLPLISETTEVDVICPVRPFSRLSVPPGVAVVPPSRFHPDRYDVVFHHLANNPHHEYVFESAVRSPGVCVLHEVVLHHLIAYSMVEVGRQAERYRRILEEEHGALGAQLANLKLRGLATELEKFLFPLVTHVVARSLGVVVHSYDSRERLLGLPRSRDVPIEVIPHHAGTPPRRVVGLDRPEARRILGLPEETFLVGHLGFLTVSKQPATLVDGFDRLHQERPDSMLLVVGADATEGALGRAVRARGLRDAVTFTGWVDLERFYLYLKAVDAVVSLRYPTAGETSGPVARALAEGRVAIVNNYGSFADLPREVVRKVEVDGDQGAELGRHLVELARDPALRSRLEASARRYASIALDPGRCRDLYLEFGSRLIDSRQPRTVSG